MIRGMVLGVFLGLGMAWAYDRHEARRFLATLERNDLIAPYRAPLHWNETGDAVETWLLERSETLG